MELGHLLTSSGLTRLEVSLMVFPVLLPICCFLVFSVTYYKPFCLHVATNLLCIPVFCPKLGLYFLLQSLCLSYNLCVACCFHIYFISAAVILLASLA